MIESARPIIEESKKNQIPEKIRKDFYPSSENSKIKAKGFDQELVKIIDETILPSLQLRIKELSKCLEHLPKESSSEE